MQLADLQQAVRTALVSGDSTALAGQLRGGSDPSLRLAIHQRHYRASLTRALVERFPATVWLVGSELVSVAAEAYIGQHPPQRPCIAEYGEAFPIFLASMPGTEALPYLGQFATLEWHLGRLALATDRSEHTVRVALDWNLDELIQLYLADTVPEHFALRQEVVRLEVIGCRGELTLQRVPAEVS